MAKRVKVFGRGAFNKARRGDSSGVFIIDDVTSFYTIAEKNFPQATARSLRHVSYLIHRTAKRYMANDGHGKPLTDLTKSRVLDKFAKRGNTRRKKFAGDLSGGGKGLARAIKYDNNKGNKFEYLVGWASNDARRVSGPRFQGGSARVMNASMRRFLAYAASQYPKRSKFRRILLSMASRRDGYRFKSPKRDVIDPVYSSWGGGQIQRVFEKRLLRNLERLDDESYTAWLGDFTAVDQNKREAVEIAQDIRTNAGKLRRRTA